MEDLAQARLVWESGGNDFGQAKHATGMVFSMGTTGRIFAFAAPNGQKLGGTKAEPQMTEQRDKFLATPHVL